MSECRRSDFFHDECYYHADCSECLNCDHYEDFEEDEDEDEDEIDFIFLGPDPF